MADPRIVKTAQQAPGVCFLTGESQGPFLDTGKHVRRVGRIYLSLRHLTPLLRQAGFAPVDELEEEFEEAEQLRAENEELRGKADSYDELLETLQGLLPEVEPETVEVKVPTYRKPTDEELDAYLEANPNHRVIRRHRPPEPGSLEEYNRLYGDKGLKVPKIEQDRDLVEKEQDPHIPELPTYTLYDQEINLDEVLAKNVDDVLSYASEHEEGLADALARREIERAKLQGVEPRSSLLDGLGWESPSDDEDDDSDEETEEDDDELGDYNEWSVEDLKEELHARELKVSGNKDELVARLEADDAEGDEDDDDEEDEA